MQAFVFISTNKYFLKNILFQSNQLDCNSFDVMNIIFDFKVLQYTISMQLTHHLFWEFRKRNVQSLMYVCFK